MQVPIKDLTIGDRVLFPGTPEMGDPDQWLKLTNVWRYGDGSISLEFAGPNPGLWLYRLEDQKELITIA